jgi:hypothetical protein
MNAKRLVQRLALVAAAAFAGAADAQESAPATGGQAIGGLFESFGFRKAPPPAEDFVRETRPDRMDYVPLAPKPETNAKQSTDKLRAVGSELDRAIAENRRKAARVKIPN